MTYTGSGLVYNGVLLGSTGPGQATSFSTTTTIDPSSPGTGTSVSGPGVDAMLIMPGEVPTGCILLCSSFIIITGARSPYACPWLEETRREEQPGCASSWPCGCV